MKLLPSQARAEGYTIDQACYPWRAYHNPQVQPGMAVDCFTDLEEQALKAVDYLYGSAHRHLVSKERMDEISAMMRAVADQQLEGL